MNRTDEFLNELNKASVAKIPDRVIEKLKLLLLDYIGVTLVGANRQKEKIQRAVDSEMDCGSSSIIGIGGGHTLKNAIFFNGLSAHTLDFDDGVNRGIIHLGSPIFSALLPIMEKYNVEGEKILAAAALGYETSFTMATSIQPIHKQMGYHATGTCGTLGVAMAVAEALEFDEKQKKDAFSVAALSASGSLKVLEDGSVLKPYNVAKAALNGYISAQMGMLGYEGPDDALSGENGFLRIMTGNPDMELQPVSINGSYAIEKAYIKPYAACRYCHPAIEAAIHLKENVNIETEEIESILVKTYRMAVNKHDHTEIKGCSSAKMSIPYSVAVAYVTGKAGIKEFEEEWVCNEDVLALASKVSVSESPEFTQEFPNRTIAELEMKTKSGQSYHEFAEYPKGEPENPLSEDEVKDKFYSMGTLAGKTMAELQKIIEIVYDFEHRSKELFPFLC